MLIEETNGRAATSIKETGLEDLPDGDVLVVVAFSSLNYKDGLPLSAVATRWPTICRAWLDLAGTVIDSDLSAAVPATR